MDIKQELKELPLIIAKEVFWYMKISFLITAVPASLACVINLIRLGGLVR